MLSKLNQKMRYELFLNEPFYTLTHEWGTVFNNKAFTRLLKDSENMSNQIDSTSGKTSSVTQSMTKRWIRQTILHKIDVTFSVSWEPAL